MTIRHQRLTKILVALPTTLYATAHAATIVVNTAGGAFNAGDPTYSLVEAVANANSTAAAVPFLSHAQDLKGSNPQLFPLANYDGPTLTHLIPISSPAINNGDRDNCVDKGE